MSHNLQLQVEVFEGGLLWNIIILGSVAQKSNRI